jgi:hypothetical protein
MRRYARRVTPLAMEAYRRWQALSPEDKERYKRQARGYTDRGRQAIEQARHRRGDGGGKLRRKR